MVTADHLMIDRRIIQEGETLIAAGHDVTLLAGFECPKRESLNSHGLRIERFVYDWGDSRFGPIAARLRLPPRLNALAWRGWRWASDRLLGFSSFDQYILDRLLEYPVDVLHVHDFPMLRAGVEVARIRKVPLVYDAHELYHAQVQFPSATQRRYRSLEGKWIRHVDKAITVNPYIARLMAERYGVPPPEVILNAAPLQLRCTEESLRKLVREHGLEDRVHFYGGVPSEALHTLTCEADIGVIPYFGVDDNNFFCSPNKLFEFAAAELPYLSNDLPFLRDIIERFGNGITADLSSPESIAQAVNRVMADPATLERLRVGARAAKQVLNWEVEGRKLLDIYRSLGPAFGDEPSRGIA
jgi:glycosyltransferase involved in cell wall biosynthesis